VECELENAKTVSERLRKSIEGHQMMSEGRELSIRISIGVAQLSLQEENWEALIKRADQALYRAKAAGRNRVEASPEP
jgi:diguanylate cyclase (GGDEF)-like protein